MAATAGARTPEEELRGKRARFCWKFVGLAYLVYFALELLVLPYVAPRVSLRTRAELPAPLFVLGASSKSRLLPRDYILVLGDSYAEGLGDWLSAALESPGNAPFQATHVLHERTGRDVINFGRSGADPVTSVAFMTEKRTAALGRLGLDEPRDVLVYFTESSDLVDGLEHAQRRLDLGVRAADSYTDAELAAFVEARAAAGYREGLVGTLFVPYLIANAIKRGTDSDQAVPGSERSSRFLPWEPGDDPAQTRNVCRAGESYFRYTGTWKGPALELDEAEVELAFGLVRQSLTWARERFAASSITFVYLPSPLACYEILSPEVDTTTFDDRPGVYPSELVRQRSNDLRRRARQLADELGVGFLDTTPGLRAAARRGPIHGPLDGKHPNRAGYTALGEILAGALGAPLAGTRIARGD